MKKKLYKLILLVLTLILINPSLTFAKAKDTTPPFQKVADIWPSFSDGVLKISEAVKTYNEGVVDYQKGSVDEGKTKISKAKELLTQGKSEIDKATKIFNKAFQSTLKD